MTTEYLRGHIWTTVLAEDLPLANRLNPAFFDEKFVQAEHQLRQLNARPLDRFIPDKQADGAKGITYGQVGSRKLNPKGAVRYLQVVNIRETGIDFAIKPDRVSENSHNDPPRSRVQKDDILLTNTGFRGTENLLGRCVVVHKDYGRLNISQDIDRIRVAGVNPYYVGAYLKTSLAQMQIERRLHGVDSQKINFGHVRSLLIPDLAAELQEEVQRQYLGMAERHDRAMEIKERLLSESGVEPGQYGQTINALAMQDPTYRQAFAAAESRMAHLLEELVAVIEGKHTKLNPFLR